MTHFHISTNFPKKTHVTDEIVKREKRFFTIIGKTSDLLDEEIKDEWKVTPEKPIFEFWHEDIYRPFMKLYYK